MIKALLEGIVCGLVLSMMLGPVFFGLLHTSIYKGFRKAVVYASGVASSDSFFILITYFGITGFMEDPRFRNIMMLVGGIIMMAFGVYYILKSAPDTLEVSKEKKSKSSSRKRSMWFKGFVLNAVNPSVFLFWIGTVSFVSLNYNNERYSVFVFFLASILVVFGLDVLKAYIAHKIKIYFTVRLLNKMNKVLGIIILLAGLKLIGELIWPSV
jgi:threonine/homoserine/homoserine lactone efflux protein